jgi:hypothetical protein
MANQNSAPGYDTAFIDRLFDDTANTFEKAVSSVGRCAQTVENMFGGADSRRNMGYPAYQNQYGYAPTNGGMPMMNNPQPVQYGYGYGSNAAYTGFDNFWGNGQPGSMMNTMDQADGFWNPAYGMGVY